MIVQHEVVGLNQLRTNAEDDDYDIMQSKPLNEIILPVLSRYLKTRESKQSDLVVRASCGLLGLVVGKMTDELLQVILCL